MTKYIVGWDVGRGMQWGYVEAEDIDEATAHAKEFHDNALDSSYWAEPAEHADTNEYEISGECHGDLVTKD